MAAETESTVYTETSPKGLDHDSFGITHTEEINPYQANKTPEPTASLADIANAAEVAPNVDAKTQFNREELIKMVRDLKVAVEHDSKRAAVLVEVNALLKDLENDEVFTKARGFDSRQDQFATILQELDETTRSAFEKIQVTGKSEYKKTTDPVIKTLVEAVVGTPTKENLKAQNNAAGMVAEVKESMGKKGEDLINKVSKAGSAEDVGKIDGATAMIRMNILLVYIRSTLENIDDKETQLKVTREILEKSKGLITETMRDSILEDLFPDANKKTEQKTTPAAKPKTELQAKPLTPMRPAAQEIVAAPSPEKKTRKGFEEKLKEETKVIKDAVERESKSNTKLMRKQAWEAAFREVMVYGKIDEESVKNILEKYSESIGDLKDEKNALMQKAFNDTVRQKREEAQYMIDLNRKAEAAYDTAAARDVAHTASKDQFMDQFVLEELSEQIILNRADLSPLEKQQLRAAMKAGIKDGRVILRTPLIERTTENGIYLANSMPPVLVATPDLLAQLTGAPSREQTPRGATFDLTTTSDKEIKVIALQNIADPEHPETPSDTFNHEMLHVWYTENRNLLKNKYFNQVNDRFVPTILNRFFKQLDPNNPQQYDSKNKEHQHLAAVIALLINDANPQLSRDADEKTRQLFEYCTKNAKGKIDIERIAKVYNSLRDEVSSPLEEIITLGTDMFEETSLGELGIEDYDPKNPKHQAALALMRSYNMLWNTPTTVVKGTPEGSPDWLSGDHTFYEEHKKYLTTQILRNLNEHSNFTPAGVVELIKKIRETGEGVSPEGRKCEEIYNSFGLSIDAFSRDKIFADTTIIALNNLQRSINVNTITDLVSALQKDGVSAATIKNIETDLKNGHGDLESVLIYLKFLKTDASEAEKEGQLGAREYVKFSGPNSYYRKWFDTDVEKFGVWGKKNYGHTWLEAVPLIGPLGQNLIDTFNPMSPVYRRHPKDPGPFGGIPILNRKNWYELGIVGEPEGSIYDTNDPLEGLGAVFGLNLYRNPTVLRWKKEKWFPKFLMDKPISLPEVMVQPGLKTYNALVAQMIGMALANAGISETQKTLIYSVMGGISIPQGIDKQDWQDRDEYRMNFELADFVRDEVAREYHKSDNWTETWTRYLTQDAYIVDGQEIAITRENAHQVRKGTITKNLMIDICESLNGPGEPQDSTNASLQEKAKNAGFKDPVEYKRQQFEVLAQMMMKADQDSRMAGGEGFTMENLHDIVTGSEDVMKPISGRFNDPDSKAYVKNPYITIKVAVPNPDKTINGGEDIEEEIGTIDTIIAKEFMAHYYLARLNTITNIGVWGMANKRINPYMGGEPQDTPVAVILDKEDGRKYTLHGKRKISDTDDGGVMMTSADVVDPLKIMSSDMLGVINGKKGELVKGSGERYTMSITENMAHDAVLGALEGGRKGRELAFMFTAKIRQAESFRDMAKNKKELWDSTNNAEDGLRFLVLAYCLATFLVPGLSFAFSPQLVLGLLGWSFTVSPFVNRNMSGWSQREKAANEAVATMIGQYAGMFYPLAEDTYHSVNDIRHARTTFEAVKGVYKSVMVDLGKQATHESNYLVRQTKSLLSRLSPF